MPGAKKPSKGTKPKRPTKKPSAKSVQELPTSRRLRAPRYRAFRLSKRIKHPVKLPSAWKIAKQTRQLIYKHWEVIGGIVIIYGLLNLVLVRGFSGGLDVSQLKNEFDKLFNGTLGHLTAGLSIFALLVGTSTTTSGTSSSGTYQSLLVIVVSLALIWAYRQIMAGNKIRIRDAYYRGMYPVIPVMLVLLVISLQLIPLIVGGWLYGIVTQNGIAVTVLEQVLWGGIFFLLALLSIYMVSSSIFALYIVTLEGMAPMKALRSARQLVRFRRWIIVSKVLFLPLWLLIVGTLIMLPIILVVPVVAQWTFFVLTMLALAFGHGYMYTFYRELLREK